MSLVGMIFGRSGGDNGQSIRGGSDVIKNAINSLNINSINKEAKEAKPYQSLEVKGRSSKSQEDLLYRLSKQHRSLNQQQKALEKALLDTDKNIRQTLSLVSEFKQGFEAHVLLEQVDFYNYLQQLFADDANQLDKLKLFRQDLNPVINEVLRYCNRYNSVQKLRQGKAEFQKDGIELRRLVKKRSRLEERELFPVYAKAVSEDSE